MAKTFFQKIFCENEPNVFVIENEENDDNIFNQLQEELNKNEKVNLSKNEKPDFNYSGQGFDVNDTAKISNFGMSITQEIDERRNYDAELSPVVTGLIFEDTKDEDSDNFLVKNNSNQDNHAEIEVDDEAQSLIELLKSEGIEKEKQKRVLEDIETREDEVETEIDIPIL